MSDIIRSITVTKSYLLDGCMNQEIIKGVTLNIKKGEFVSLMGASGSGKSTLLYNLSGMDSVSSGSVFFGNLELNKLDENELARIRLNRMGFVFQHIHLLRNLSIFDNIVISAYLAKKKSRHEVNEKANMLMKKVGIVDLAKRNITQASGGQLQRAAICRALINDPEIIFCDEPTGALNSKSTEEIMNIFNTINKNGTAIFLATHDVKVAAKTDRVIYLVDGQVADEYCFAQQYSKDTDNAREKLLADWLIEKGF